MSDADLQHFATHGYVIAKGVVDPAMCEAARRIVNRALGKGVAAADAAKARLTTWFPELTGHPSLVSLLNGSPQLRATLRALLGADPPVYMHCQIALRIPGDLCMVDSDDTAPPVPVPWWRDVYHIDGLDKVPTPSATTYNVRNFTLLVGIPLADVTRDLAGNLVVYPGSHWDTEKFFQQDNAISLAEANGVSALLPLRAAGECVKMSAGDVVIAHYNMCHSIAPNVCADIRYQIYFRINVRAGGMCHIEPLKNMWVDFSEKVRRMAEGARGQVAWGAARSGTTPGYADGRATPAAAAATATELQAAKAAFMAHNWAAASPLLEAVLNKNVATASWEIQFFAAIAFTWHPEVVPWTVKGEKLLRRMLGTYRGVPNVPSVLAQNLLRQCREHPTLKTSAPAVIAKIRTEAAGHAYDALVTCGRADDPKSLVMDCLKSASEGGMAPEALRALAATAAVKYPSLKVDIDTQVSSGGLAVPALWVEGKQWIASPNPKDLVSGLRIFSAITTASPRDYWGAVLHGGCLFWLGRPAEAEALLRRAVAVDPTFPNAYSLLAQCLAAQGKDPLPVVDAMLAQEPLTVKDADAENSVVEAIKCAAKGPFGNRRSPSDRFSTIVETACILWPSLTMRVRAL